GEVTAHGKCLLCGYELSWSIISGQASDGAVISGLTRLFFFILACICVTGCTVAAYPGARLPWEQAAYLSRHHYSLGRYVCIDQVDEQESGHDNNFTQYEIAPGPHKVRVTVADRQILFPLCGPLGCPFKRYDYFGPVELSFGAEAGHTYNIGMKKIDA